MQSSKVVLGLFQYVSENQGWCAFTVTFTVEIQCGTQLLLLSKINRLMSSSNSTMTPRAENAICSEVCANTGSFIKWPDLDM